METVNSGSRSVQIPLCADPATSRGAFHYLLRNPYPAKPSTPDPALALVQANENLKPDPHPAQLRPDLTTLSKSINNRQLTALVTGSLSGRHTFLIIFRPKAH